MVLKSRRTITPIVALFILHNNRDKADKETGMSFQAPITIRKALENIDNQRYLIPAIQREFVWDAPQIEQLFDSVLRG